MDAAGGRCAIQLSLRQALLPRLPHTLETTVEQQRCEVAAYWPLSGRGSSQSTTLI
jgi:hypothetical protein